MTNKPVLFFKAHVDQFTRKDGTVVQAHDTKVVAKAKTLGGGGAAKKGSPEHAAAMALIDSGNGLNWTGNHGKGSVKTVGDEIHLHDTHAHSANAAKSAEEGKKDWAPGGAYHSWMKDQGVNVEHIGSTHGENPKAGAFASYQSVHKIKVLPKDGAGVQAKLSPEQVSAVFNKHAAKFARKSPEWNNGAGARAGKIPAADVQHAPEFSHHEVYGTDSSSPESSDFSADFAAKGHQGFVVKHPSGQRHFVDTQGYGYARYHAAIDDSAKPAVSHEAAATAAMQKPEHKAVVAAASRGEIDLQHAAEKHALGKRLSALGPHGEAAGKLFDAMGKGPVAAASRGELDMQHHAEKVALGKMGKPAPAKP